MTETLLPNQSLIAIRPDGYVDGACFTQSELTDSWVQQMKAEGCRMQTVARDYAKSVLGTTLID